jgi:DNA ligase (NAD+)
MTNSDDGQMGLFSEKTGPSVDELVQRLKDYNQAYRAGQPEVSDDAYDQLTEQLRTLDAKHPWLQHVEPEPDFGAGKIRHPQPMLSTEKAYRNSDVEAWIGDESSGDTLTLSAWLDYEERRIGKSVFTVAKWIQRVEDMAFEIAVRDVRVQVTPGSWKAPKSWLGKESFTAWYMSKSNAALNKGTKDLRWRPIALSSDLSLVGDGLDFYSEALWTTGQVITWRRRVSAKCLPETATNVLECVSFTPDGKPDLLTDLALSTSTDLTWALFDAWYQRSRVTLTRDAHSKHRFTMDDSVTTHTLTELLDYEQRLRTTASTQTTYTVTPKLDGLAGRDDGVALATRGDGMVGSDATHVFARGVVPVGGRGLGIGEIVMVESWFDAVLKGRVEHPRNACVGIVNADTLAVEAKEALDAGMVHFVPYTTLPSWTGLGITLLTELATISTQVKAETDYPLDGLVVSVDDLALRAALGKTNHHYSWQLAIKEKLGTAKTTVKEIVWQTGRTGKVTPVLIVEPTALSGATIQRVTAHNAQIVKQRGLGAGAEILIIRSGEVIPKIESVITRAKTPDLATHCPSCGEPLAFQDKFLVCLAGLSCPAQVENSLRHFFHLLGTADNFGPKTVKRLVAGGIASLPEIYALTEADLLGLDFGPGQTANLLIGLKTSLSTTVEDARFLAAFGVDHLGLGAARRLLTAVALEDVISLSVSDMKALDGFDVKTADAITRGIAHRWPTVSHILGLGFQFERTSRAGAQSTIVSPISNQRVLFTGKMLQGTRDDMKAQARTLGAIVASGISKTLDLLVIGEKASPNKVAKAEKLGVHVLSEEEYLGLISQD